MPLTKPQQTVASSKTRFRVLITGRRFGKTTLSIRELCRFAAIPKQEVWYIAPSYKMAKGIVWRKLKKKLQDLHWISKINESELYIDLRNGSRISLKGADNHDSLRGVGLNFIVLDEFADIDPLAWYETLRPTLSDKQGQALFIGTPKGISNWSYDMYQMTHVDPNNWSSFQFTTIDGGHVPQEEIDQAMRDMDERTFRQEYLATFETYYGKIYYSFERDRNVKEYTGDLPRELLVFCDFNVNPISAAIAVQTQDYIHIIDEILIYGSNTDELVQEVRNRYAKQAIKAYPDPAGAQRKTSAGGRTDITILENAGFKVFYRRAHPAVRDRINAVNSALCSSDKKVKLYIDPKCKRVIECLEKQVYKEGTQIPDKDTGFDHMNDAIGYGIEFIYPVTKEIEIDEYAPKSWSHRAA